MLDGLSHYCKGCKRISDQQYRNTDKATKLKNKRDSYFRHRDAQKAYFKEYNKTHIRIPEDPVKRKARHALERAVKSGIILRGVCIACGDPKSEGHHEDYSKPLVVIWLCRIHHAEHHRLQEAL